MKVDRRRFLGFTAGAAAGAVVGVPASRSLANLVAAIEEPIYPPRGPEDHVLSMCRMCPGGCGLRVRRVGGRPVKLDGNPLHSVNGGRLCPKGQAALQSLYHPDRLSGPMRRVGPPGSIDSFEPASWEEALGQITERLQLLRQVGRPESLALVRGDSRGLGSRLAERFLQAFGSPNDIHSDYGEEAAALAMHFSQGVRVAPTYDVQSTDYVLSFGGPLLEAWSSPVHMMRAYGEFRQGRPGRRGKLVQIESRLSITASSADEWIAVRPGTEGILALGVAQVLVAEGLYDRDFVNERCLGFDSFRDRDRSAGEDLRSFLEESFQLESVATETGVSVNVILRIAREFAAARSQLAVAPRKGPLLPGTLFDHLAVQVLNALVGNLDAIGGVLVPDETPLAGWPALPADPISEAGLARPRLDGAGTERFPHLESNLEGLAAALLEGGQYPLEVLMILGADPAFASMAPERFARGLEKVPMVVSLATLPDDTALLADWILPESHFLESWDLETTPPGLPYPVVSLAQPCLENPLFDSRPAAEIFLDLARRVGDEVAAAFPWPDLDHLIRAEVEGLYAARRGAIMGTQFDTAWVRMMERAGWWAPGYRSPQELWQKMQETGGWWDPFYDRRVFRTDSGRFEFRTDLLRDFAADRRASSRRTAASAAEATEGDRPLLALLLFEPLSVSGGTGAELPFLQEILDPGHEARWETWAELNPETAEQLQVGDRERVRITSDEGTIEASARVTRRVVPGAVAIPVGLGKKGGGRWSAGRGANPLRLLSVNRESVSGLPDPGATRVRVSRLGRRVESTTKRS
jgi:anaerobic selenocysteine-containing dehydrogenase